MRVRLISVWLTRRIAVTLEHEVRYLRVMQSESRGLEQRPTLRLVFRL